MTDKQLALETLNKLSETTSMQEIAEEIEIMAAIRRGEEAAAAGQVKPHEEVKKMFASWISK